MYINNMTELFLLRYMGRSGDEYIIIVLDRFSHNFQNAVSYEIKDVLLRQRENKKKLASQNVHVLYLEHRVN